MPVPMRRQQFLPVILIIVTLVREDLSCSAETHTGKNGSTANPACAPETAATDSGCGEVDESGWSCGLYTCPEKFFSVVAGDEPLLKPLKNQTTGDLTWNAGGELRYRYMNEKNRLRAGGPGHSAYDLWRLTPFVEMTYSDLLGGYVQAIDASMTGLDAPYSTTPGDVNRTDLLQYYAELRIPVADGQLRYRYGRQFLQYGAQRVLSPLGWSNTFRNFEGHKVVYTHEDLSIDGFVMQSLNGTAGNTPHPQSFDIADSSRWISGLYSTWKGLENNDLDLYFLHFEEKQPGTAAMDGRRNTLGTRLAGKQTVKPTILPAGTWNWDVEGAWQFGRDNFGTSAMREVQAGMVGALGGYTFDELPWQPSPGAIFYYGSGDRDPASGQINTYTSLYPLGHAYWGQIDNFSGQNLVDYGLQFSVKPASRLSIVNQWHWFDLAQTGDRIYNIAGTPLNGSGDRNVGNELDVVARYTHSKTLNVELGYLMFFYGDAVGQGPLARADAEQLYLQATYSF
ncbi:MAG: alginate export family protein [Planctomycetia bacterium]